MYSKLGLAKKINLVFLVWFLNFLLLDSLWKSMTAFFSQISDISNCIWVKKGQTWHTQKNQHFLILSINFEYWFYIVSKSVVVSIMNYKSLCLSVSKTYIVSTPAPTVQGSSTAVVCCASQSFSSARTTSQ